mmetsp:Transcript_42635/g.68446  ORF Transcript_42635/g.68446 Transcript_42635/m.68446 type:complete len:268 (+) Transcript_42635:25-828(+)
MADTDEPASFITNQSSIYEVGSPSKFDITVFPNASQIRVVEKKTKHEKIEPPNAQLRPLTNVPIPMPEDEEVDEITAQDTAVITKSIDNYTNPSKLYIILRYVATALAVVVQLLLFIAMCVAKTASASWEATYLFGSGSDQTTIECSWLFLTVNGTKSETEIGGAFVCLLFMLIAFILNVWAIVYAQPYKIKQRHCFPAYYPRIIFSVAFLCILIAIIAFAAADSICYANNELIQSYSPALDFKLGASLILTILALIAELPCCVIAM